MERFTKTHHYIYDHKKNLVEVAEVDYDMACKLFWQENHIWVKSFGKVLRGDYWGKVLGLPAIGQPTGYNSTKILRNTHEYKMDVDMTMMYMKFKLDKQIDDYFDFLAKSRKKKP